MSCDVMANAGMCHFSVRVFNAFLEGTTEGNR
eukprot:COSAG02_NODE_25941_length_645_cov_0.752747_1_plen_31_part_10